MIRFLDPDYNIYIGLTQIHQNWGNPPVVAPKQPDIGSMRSDILIS